MAESTPRGIEYNTPQYLVAAATTINAGDMVGLVSGYLVPVTATTGIKVKGIACKTVVNTVAAGFGAAGDLTCPVELSYSDKGLRVYKMLNTSAPNAAAQAEVGTTMYGVDAKTISKTSTGKSAVGELFRIDPVDGLPWIIFNA